MKENVKTPSEVKAMFRAKGETFAQWAKDNGYDPTHVSRQIPRNRRETRLKSGGLITQPAL